MTSFLAKIYENKGGAGKNGGFNTGVLPLKGNCHLKITVFPGSVFKSGFPFFNRKGSGHNTVCLQISVGNIFDYERIAVRA